MKKLWLRGTLLGVSLALLLAGGVALANGAFVRVGLPCFECLESNEPPYPDEYIQHIDYGGWSQSTQAVCVGISNPYDSDWFSSCLPQHRITDPCWVEFVVFCDGDDDGYNQCLSGLEQPLEVAPTNLNGVESMYGEWVGWVEEWDGGELIGYAEATFLFADDCAAATFVPEPGTIALLGSGLVGLAGYATLRLGSGQAFRWRTRE